MARALIITDDAHFPLVNLGPLGSHRIETRIRGLTLGQPDYMSMFRSDGLNFELLPSLTQLSYFSFKSGDSVFPASLSGIVDVEFQTLARRFEHKLRFQFDASTLTYTIEIWNLADGDHQGIQVVNGVGGFVVSAGSVSYDSLAIGNSGFGSKSMPSRVDYFRIYNTVLPYGSAAPVDAPPSAAALYAGWEFQDSLADTVGTHPLVWQGGGAPTYEDQPDRPGTAPVLSSATYGSDAVALAFTDPNASPQDETAVDIERRLGTTGDWLRLGYAPAGSTSFSDTRILHATGYQYRVKARNRFGSSAYSNIVSVTTGAGTDTNPTVTENAKTGTAAWTLTNPATEREIEGYCDQASINRGGTINLKVNSAAGQNFNLEIFRMGWYGGLGARRIRNITNVTGTAQTMPVASGTFPRYQFTCQWTTSYALALTDADPTEWPSGHYLARCTQVTSGKQVYLHFVVRDDSRPAAHLVNCPTNTYHAYSAWPNLLSDTGRTSSGRGWYNISRTGGYTAEASYNRPYQVLPRDEAAYAAGAGELLGITAPRNTYADRALRTVSSEISWVRWLEKNGHDVKYCTDMDLHTTGDAIWSNVSSILFPGHQEYWSYDMRQTVKAARDYGINLAFLGANAIFWPVRFENDPISGQVNRCMVGYKDSADGGVDPYDSVDYRRGTSGIWRNRDVGGGGGTAEAAIIGVQYESDPAADATMQFTAAITTDPLGSGTTLTGSSTAPGLVGYEWDRIYPQSPAGIVNLAHSLFTPGAPTNGTLPVGTSDVTVYRASSGAEVFASGSMQLIWAADDYKVPTLRPDYAHAGAAALIANVVNRQGTPTIAEAGTGGGGGGGGTGRRPLRRFGLRTRRV